MAAARAELVAACPPPDVAVVNRVLPDGDGGELGPDLAAAGVPGVAFCGLAYPADVRDSLAGGFATHLTKPIDIGEIEAVIRRLTP